jgi:hypothetical protein
VLCDRYTEKGHDWTCVIIQDLPRTFPGHPALGEDGLNALRRMLTAYARHNPAVGYCQVLRCLFFLAMTYDDALELPHTIGCSMPTNIDFSLQSMHSYTCHSNIGQDPLES